MIKIWFDITCIVTKNTDCVILKNIRDNLYHSKYKKKYVPKLNLKIETKSSEICNSALERANSLQYSTYREYQYGTLQPNEKLFRCRWYHLSRYNDRCANTLHVHIVQSKDRERCPLSNPPVNLVKWKLFREPRLNTYLAT